MTVGIPIEITGSENIVSNSTETQTQAQQSTPTPTPTPNEIEASTPPTPSTPSIPQQPNVSEMNPLCLPGGLVRLSRNGPFMMHQFKNVDPSIQQKLQDKQQRQQDKQQKLQEKQQRLQEKLQRQQEKQKRLQEMQQEKQLRLQEKQQRQEEKQKRLQELQQKQLQQQKERQEAKQQRLEEKKQQQQQQGKEREIRFPLTSGTKIRLQSKATNKYLRIKQDGTVDFEGGQGPFTLFKVKSPKKLQLTCQNQILKLKSVQNPEYFLRINGQKQLDGQGHGGKWTLFELIHNENGTFSLQSVAHKQVGCHLNIQFESKEQETKNQEGNDQFSLKVIQYGKNKNKNSLYWVTINMKEGQEKIEKIPKKAVEAGQEKTGEKLFVCRVFHNGSWHPGKFGVHLPGAHFAFGNSEMISRNFQILCGKGAKWQKLSPKQQQRIQKRQQQQQQQQQESSSMEGIKKNMKNKPMMIKVPKDSFVAGTEANFQQKLFVTRIITQGGLHCGKYGTHLTQGAHIPFGGKVIHSSDFEILVV